jgi:class 3 adenylate cyclase
MTAMTEALFEHRGFLDKYIGDGLMAFFRIGEPPMADAQQAVRAAIAMQQAASGVSGRLVAGGREPLRIGIGMHCGEAVVGLVGSVHQPDYTVLGQATVVSFRLQGLARGGEIVVSDDLYTEASGAFAAEALPPAALKGVAEAVIPYRILPVPAPPAEPRPAAAQPTAV